MLRKLWYFVLDKSTHFWGMISRKYYFEDFVRVYPDGNVYNRYGEPQKPSQNDINNYLNHQKFYRFAAQFVHGGNVADIGCGSGYGCKILKDAGALSVRGADLSKSSIAFARKHYSQLAEFSIQGITNLKGYKNDAFDLTISSEVLEHIKEYGKERKAIEEIKRITRPGGIIVLGTPNSELLGGHGFYYDEMRALMSEFFDTYCIFENALIPFGENRPRWEKRSSNKETGIIVSQSIALSETVLEVGQTSPEVKRGIEPGIYPLGKLSINTELLHNTHSWIVVAIKD
jgi:2-polyprenyl-3-methyl-5-hydroxy-6-metoxy-1,4-benzoquinol methylase